MILKIISQLERVRARLWGAARHFAPALRSRARSAPALRSQCERAGALLSKSTPPVCLFWEHLRSRARGAPAVRAQCERRRAPRPSGRGRVRGGGVGGECERTAGAVRAQVRAQCARARKRGKEGGGMGRLGLTADRRF